jgi:ornithine carbamoyltransferase
MRNLISLNDLSNVEIINILNRSKRWKDQIKSNDYGEGSELFKNKTLALLFSKKSTRTRVSCETAWNYFGGKTLFLGANDIHLSSDHNHGESLQDTIQVLSSMVDILVARVHSHSEILQIAKYSSKPVVNALSDRFHPLQALADLLTLVETFPNQIDLEHPENTNLLVCWIGDSNNVLNSLLMCLPRFGIRVHYICPESNSKNIYGIDIFVIKYIRDHNLGHLITHSYTPYECLSTNKLNVIITDTWVSMGQEEYKIQDFTNFQVTENLVNNVLKPESRDWKFMHCMPRHQLEVDDQVFYHPKRSLVFQEAENRKYTTMAVFEFLKINK